MAQLRFKNTVKYKDQFVPANTVVEVDDRDIPELLKIGAYDVKTKELPVFEATIEPEKPRKRGKK